MRKAHRESDRNASMLAGAIIPSPVQRAAAIEAIRARDHRALVDAYPADIASPTALYLGVTISTMWHGISATTLADASGIAMADAFEFGELVDLAKYSDWIEHKIIQAAIVAIAADPADQPQAEKPIDAILGQVPPPETMIAPPAPERAPDDEPRPARQSESQRTAQALLSRYSTAALPRVVIRPKPEVVCDDTTGPVTLMQLKEHSCRWPLGMPGTPEFRFCGAYRKPGATYCEPHRERAIAKPVVALATRAAAR